MTYVILFGGGEKMIKNSINDDHVHILREFGLEDIDYTNLSLLRYESGEFIYLQGNTIKYLLLFLSGKAKVFFTSSNGKTLLMAYYTKIGLIGDSELMADKEIATSSVQAISDVTCIGILLQSYKKYLKNNLKFMNSVGIELANKLHNSTLSSTFNILHSLDIRLCAYIAMTNKNGYFKEKLTELSEIMGTSYRHLLRTLNRLCNDGLLEKTQKGYLILNKIALQNKANEYYK